MGKIKTAIVGLGNIGIFYDLNNDKSWKVNQTMSHTKAVMESLHFEIEYLVDDNIEILNQIKNTFPGITCLPLNEVLSLPEPNLVIISTPTKSHFEVSKKISEKWFFCNYLVEKPVGNDSNECLKILSLLSRQENIVYINYFRRFLPHFHSLIKLSVFETRGELQRISINAYGTLTNIYSHFLDLVTFFEGREILGLGKKRFIFKQSGSISFLDKDTNIYFNFRDIDSSKDECSMKLEYENLIINITQNGQIINLLKINGTFLDHLDLGRELFNSYQSFVLDKINLDIKSFSAYTGGLDAIHVHKFIESLE